MKNIQEVRASLVSVFNGVKSRKMPPKVANSLTNTVGKIISTVRLELDYSAARKEKPEIKFLGRSNAKITCKR